MVGPITIPISAMHFYIDLVTMDLIKVGFSFMGFSFEIKIGCSFFCSVPCDVIKPTSLANPSP